MGEYQRIRKQRAIQQAEGYLELNMPRQALDVLERLRAHGPFTWRESFLQGEALRNLELFNEAVAVLVQAAQDFPEHIATWLALGWCYKRTGRLEKAIYALRKALEIEPEEALVHYNLACYYSLLLKKDDAINSLARALDLDADYRKMVRNEPDFDPIRSDPDFQSLLKVVV